jgi:hypothetical protein
MSIPLQPLAEQARIVAILDKFDTLTHSISEGLPREIALRQKQYEYYRDLLLSFPKTKEEQSVSIRKECRICKVSFLMPMQGLWQLWSLEDLVLRIPTTT